MNDETKLTTNDCNVCQADNSVTVNQIIKTSVKLWKR